MHTVLVVLAILGLVFLTFILLAALGHQRYGWTSADTARSAAQVTSAPYWYRCLVAIDLCANVFLNGMFGMTLSTRIAIWAAMKRSGPTGWFIRMLLWALEHLQRAHGDEAMSGDVARATIAIVTIQPWLDRQTVASRVFPDKIATAPSAKVAASVKGALNATKAR